ncbi:MAG: FesM, partial [Chloroflexota bacterium]
CPHDNVGWQLRIPLQELWQDPFRSGIGRLSQRSDLAVLMLVLTFGAYFNAFGMITPVYTLQRNLSLWLGTESEALILLLIFGVGLIILPIILLTTTSFLTQLLVKQAGDSIASTARRFTYSLVPVGFGMWLAHYAFHFLTGALVIIPVTQSFLNDSGIFVGEPAWHLGPIVPAGWLFPIQALFLYMGLFGSLIVAFQIALHHYETRYLALRAFIPWGILSILMFLFALWIMFQPMEMRGTIFLGL